MPSYKNILLALELTEADGEPVAKALNFVKEMGAKLTVLHAIEHISSYGAAYGIAVGADIEEMLMEEATKKMEAFGKKHGVDATRLITKFGPAKMVILEQAEKLGVDLIIVGSHGRHGVRLLLGSTANAVLHAAQCDVLAVRLA